MLSIVKIDLNDNFNKITVVESPFCVGYYLLSFDENNIGFWINNRYQTCLLARHCVTQYTKTTKQLKLTADRKAFNVQIMVIMSSKKSLLNQENIVISVYLHLACVNINRKVIDTEMKSFRVFIRGDWSPFIINSPLNCRIEIPPTGKKGTKTLFNLATNRAAF